MEPKSNRTDTEFKERGITQWSNEMGRPVQYVRAMFARELEYELERLKDENPQCDDVYWSDHWQCYYARWTNGKVEPLRDSEEARQTAYKWGIRFRNGAAAPPPEDNAGAQTPPDSGTKDHEKEINTN